MLDTSRGLVACGLRQIQTQWERDKVAFRSLASEGQALSYITSIRMSHEAGKMHWNVAGESSGLQWVATVELWVWLEVTSNGRPRTLSTPCQRFGGGEECHYRGTSAQ